MDRAGHNSRVSFIATVAINVNIKYPMLNKIRCQNGCVKKLTNNKTSATLTVCLISPIHCQLFLVKNFSRVVKIQKTYMIYIYSDEAILLTILQSVVGKERNHASEAYLC